MVSERSAEFTETARQRRQMQRGSGLVIGARHAGIKTDGRAATFYDAKAQFQDNYRKWLAWAKLEEPSS